MQSFDDYAENYDDLLRDPLRDRFAGGSDFFIQQKCRIVSHRLEKKGTGRRPMRVLDAGCGQGRAFRFFGSDTKVFGSDISHSMLRTAVHRGPVAVQEPFDLPFADGTFDAAFAFCIYHHIADDHHVRHLRELSRVVVPGGQVLVFEHNPYNPVTAKIFSRTPVDRGCHMIKAAALKAKFHDAGLVDLEHGYLLFVPEALFPSVGFLESALSWLPLGGQYFVGGRKRDSPA